MGVSFKVAKAGKRYRPKLLIEDKDSENGVATEPQGTESEGDFAEVGDRVANNSSALAKSASHSVPEDREVSFTLNLFPDGFCVGKANELLDGVPTKLPYDRASKSFFSAIEYGCLPGDILDDIPCKYVDGSVLCEIRDYRNTLSNEDDGSSEKSPIIHKVVLQLCMENVVKDISSFADDSWTYGDLLEVESRILKALKPVLNLNPKPMLHSLGERTPTKKVDLGISWTRKRKVSDTSVNTVTESGKLQCIQNSNSHSQVAEGREIPLHQQITPSSGPTSQGNNNLKETPSESFLVPSQLDSLAYSQCHSVSETQTPKQRLSNRQSDRRKASTLILSGPAIKTPKQEPLDFSQHHHQQQQLTGIQAETGLASEEQWKRNTLHQRIEAGKVLQEKIDCRKRPLASVNSDKQATLEGIPKLRAGIATCRVKEGQPTETREFSHLTKSCKVTGVTRQSDFQSLLFSSPLRANAPPSTVPFNHVAHSVGKSTANEIVTEKNGALRVSQSSAGIGNKFSGSCLGNSLPGEAPMPTKKKSNSCLKESGSSRVKSPASTSNLDTGNAICLIESLATTSDMSVDAIMHKEPSTDGIIDRFSKIEMLTQRYGLKKENHKPSQVFEKRPFFYPHPNVNLGGSEKGNLQYGNAYSFHANAQENKFSIYKTRTLKFIRSHCVSQRNEIGSDEGQTKLIIMEKLDEGLVEASFIYGDGTVGLIELPRLQSFPSSHHADLFAIQFGGLIELEGFHVVCDQIEYVPRSIEGSSVVQQPALTSSTLALTSSTFLVSETIEQSPYMPSPSQLTSPNNFLGIPIIPHGNIQFPPSNFPMAPFNIAAQLTPFYQQRQQAINQRYFLQFQRMERERVQQQLLHRSRMMAGGGGLAVAAPHLGIVQPGGGTYVGIGSSNNVMGMCGSSMSVRARASTSGFPIQRNVNMLQQQELRSPLQQHLLATNLARNLGPPPLDLVSHMDQRFQTSQQQVGSASVPQQMEGGKAVVGHESPEPSSRNHGSVGSCNKSSSMELQGVVKGESPSQTGGGK